jgi:hypothetical protein
MTLAELIGANELSLNLRVMNGLLGIRWFPAPGVMTGATSSTSIAIPNQVRSRERVPIRTGVGVVRQDTRGCPAQSVLAVSHRLQVIGIDAIPLATLVIKLLSKRDRAMASLVGITMGPARLPLGIHVAVPVLILGSLPDPAGRFKPTIFNRIVNGWSKLVAWHADLRPRSGCDQAGSVQPLPGLSLPFYQGTRS